MLNPRPQNIQDKLKEGAPPQPYTPLAFDMYRKQCAEAAHKNDQSSGFVLTTDFHTDHCSLVTGPAIDTNSTSVTAGPSMNGTYLEIWNKD